MLKDDEMIWVVCTCAEHQGKINILDVRTLLSEGLSCNDDCKDFPIRFLPMILNHWQLSQVCTKILISFQKLGIQMNNAVCLDKFDHTVME